MPLAIDLYCGLGGWTEGLQAEGWDVIGWDIERHAYDGDRYPGQLVIGDVRAIHGSQLRMADLIVGSSPCTDYSYMAMPWTLAKAKAAAIRADETGEALRKLNELFDAQFRIQREACEAKGEHIPMVVENVRGSQEWVGRAKFNFGSYYLWGDVPALMPTVVKVRGQTGEGTKVGGLDWVPPGHPRWKPGQTFNPGAQGPAIREMVEGRKNPGFRFDGSGRSFQSESVARHLEGVEPAEGRKGAGAGAAWWRNPDNPSMLPSSSPRRKAATAKIAKIPLVLSTWIGRAWFPVRESA